MKRVLTEYTLVYSFVCLFANMEIMRIDILFFDDFITRSQYQNVVDIIRDPSCNQFRKTI